MTILVGIAIAVPLIVAAILVVFAMMDQSQANQ